MTALDLVTEKDFQAQVLDLARMFGWRCYHTHDSRRSAAGFPDLVMVRRGRLIFAELKREKGKSTFAQREWEHDLRVVEGDVTVRVWRPSDFEDIVEELRR